jgi:hypothetical protein
MNKTWFDRVSPLAASLIAAAALLSAGKSPEYIQFGAITVSVALVVVWAASELPWQRLRKYFVSRRRVSRQIGNRVAVQLEHTSPILNDSYTRSPLHFWRSLSSRHHESLRLNTAHQWAIRTWLEDLSATASNRKVLRDVAFLESLSKAVSELAKLAEQVERDLDFVLRNISVTDQERKTLRRDWDSSKSHFNQLMDEWQRLFGEVNHVGGAQCFTYFRRLEMVE